MLDESTNAPQLGDGLREIRVGREVRVLAAVEVLAVVVGVVVQLGADDLVPRRRAQRACSARPRPIVPGGGERGLSVFPSATARGGRWIFCLFFLEVLFLQFSKFVVVAGSWSPKDGAQDGRFACQGFCARRAFRTRSELELLKRA